VRKIKRNENLYKMLGRKKKFLEAGLKSKEK
jgi:hypothetical protein